MKDWVRKPGMSQGLRSPHPPSEDRHNTYAVNMHQNHHDNVSKQRHQSRMKEWIPFIHNEQPGDEILGILGRICKLWLIKVPLTGQDVVQSLVVIITKEWAETAQTNRERQLSFIAVSISLPMFLWVYSQHVGDDAEAPHVCVERHKVIVDDLRSEELWSAKIHPQFLPWFITMWRDIIKVTFCMATSKIGKT